MEVSTDLNERNRIQWVEQQLKQLPSGWKILDAGAGEQQYRKYCPHLEYVSQDFAQYDPAKAPTGLQMQNWKYPKLDIVSDITAIPVPDASFDAVLCTEVLEHVPDAVTALRELSRLIKPGGVLLLTAPFCSLTHFAPYHFSSGFNRYFYERHLPAFGFGIEEFAYNGNYFSWLEQELGRLPSVSKRYTGHEPGRLEYRRISKVRKLLKEMQANDSGSSELLAFGCHIRARKQ
jgi:ubiquinone/menaquinone biosynthesis C-methylase UbiE